MALVRTDVSEERTTFIITVKTISELGTTRLHIPEDGILHSFRRENLKIIIYYKFYL
jgi:hypothetical protein